jgi:PilZ domain
MSTVDECSPRVLGPKGPSHFGPSAVVREAPAAGDVELLPLFLNRPDTSVDDRRRTPRYPAEVHRAWLGWWTGPGAFHTVAAKLEDISMGGARLHTADPPAAGQILWLCLGIPDPSECVQAKVVAVSPSAEGDCIVRVAFGAPCPRNLYQTAIYGLDRRQK